MFLERLNKDLTSKFQNVKGFSKRNLEQIRRWYLFWNKAIEIVQQPASQIKEWIVQIPWWHNIVIITKCNEHKEALFYVQKTIENGWSRAVLTHQIESGLYRRRGKAITNFDITLPKPQSDLARETIKDPYCFDFLTLREDYIYKKKESKE